MWQYIFSDIKRTDKVYLICTSSQKITWRFMPERENIQFGTMNLSSWKNIVLYRSPPRFTIRKTKSAPGISRDKLLSFYFLKILAFPSFNKYLESHCFGAGDMAVNYRHSFEELTISQGVAWGVLEAASSHQPPCQPSLPLSWLFMIIFILG